ncbi:MAG: transcription initiation factor IIB [Candidatus Bathyarchaeia archaeon]
MSENDEVPSLPPILGEIQRCPECGSTKLMRDYDAAEVVCMECGFVVDMKIADQGPEWRAFDNEQKEKRSRVGAPITFTIHDKGLSTTIDWHDKDIFRKKLDADQKAQIYRLRKWQRRIRVSDASERNLAFALSEITKIANVLSLPKSVLETSSIIYRKIIKKRLMRGRSIQGICAATVYIACRQCGLPRSLDEIASAANISKREVGRCYRFLIKELDLALPPPKANQYISKFSNQLALQGKAEEIANKILAIASRARLTSGKGPVGMAAAASYIASVLIGEKRTQREIAEIANVTEVTIRNRFKELMEQLLFIVTL